MQLFFAGKLKVTGNPMLAGKLQSHDELGGSVLDNSVILVCSENADGSHSKVNMPFLLLGSAGGHFRTGRHVQCGGVPHNRLLLSLSEAFGLPGPEGSTDYFGDPELAARIPDALAITP